MDEAHLSGAIEITSLQWILYLIYCAKVLWAQRALTKYNFDCLDGSTEKVNRLKLNYKKNGNWYDCFVF